MKILREGDPRVNKIIQNKNPDPTALYRLSNYALLSDDSEKLLFFTLSGAILSLNQNEWDALIVLNGFSSSLDFQSMPILYELAQMGILVSINTDDFKVYSSVLSLMKALEHKDSGLSTYTILTTTGCNAKCTYCYEEGMPIITMNYETADKVVDFILKTRTDNEIKLIWFGGEPLMSSHIISYICQKLSVAKVPFSSSITTNGILFDKALVDRAIKLWNLKSIQISTDGIRDDYEKRKQFCAPTIHNYAKLFEVIHLLINRKITVTLRCNYDEQNILHIRDFIEELRFEFQNSEYIFLYFRMLFQCSSSNSCIELYRKIYEIQRYMDETGFHYQKDAKNYPFKTHYCLADEGSGTVIHPDGTLYCCDLLLDDFKLGHICNCMVSFASAKAKLGVRDKCRNCPYLPLCTPFYANICPQCSEHCRALKRIEIAYHLESISLTRLT